MSFNIIQKKDGKLKIPDKVTIPFIEGDGIGRDITKPSLKLINKVVEKTSNRQKNIKWKEMLAGEKANQKAGSHLPEETLAAFQKYSVGIKGPLTTPVGKGFRSLNVALRQQLDLYVCLRPVKWIPGLPSPVKYPDKVDLHIFRENTEDIYAGIEYELGKPDNEKTKNFLLDEMQEKNIRFPDSSAFGIKPISRQGSERLIRAAINYALENSLPYITLVHKGNIMKFTEGAFKKWGYDLAEKEFSNQVMTGREYKRIIKSEGQTKADRAWEKARKEGRLLIKDVIADAFFQDILLQPEEHSVVATMNLNGDYISDMAAAMAGGIGISPGANINYDSGLAIFEATHGTAPDIAGTGQANPTSFLLSAALMLEYLGWGDIAIQLRKAIQAQINSRRVTSDLYKQMNKPEKNLSTTEFISEISDKI